MEARMKKFRQVSPERSKVWTEKSPKYHQNRKVPVVYYLCRNRQLEHPHFMEVPLSSPDGLYLRDVIERLNVLRGRGMASIYSWSSKRSYKNGFVWHDLCEDDLIHPAHGNEYVLKGSELFGESNSVPDRFSPIVNVKPQSSKLLPEQTLCSSSSSSLTGKDQKLPLREEEFSPPPERPCSSAASPESSGPSLSLTEYKVFKSDGSADASTQTEESSQSARSKLPRETCTRGVSAEIGPAGPGSGFVSVSPPPSTCSATSSSGGKTETLESLIRADAGKMNSFRILEEEEIRFPSHNNPRIKATNVLMQLISCGSISVKEHSFGGFVPTYRARFSNSKFGSPLFSASMMMGELDCLSENPKFSGMRLEDKEYFSGSLIETKLIREDGHSVLKRSSSYNADRSCKQLDPIEDGEESTSTGSKCIPRSIKASLTKQPRSESMRSPMSDRPRNSSSGGLETSKNASPCVSNGASKRFSEPFSGRNESKRLDSFRDDEKVIKIEESLLRELGL